MKMNVKITTRTNGIWVTAAAMAVGLGAVIAMGATATESRAAVAQLMVVAAILHSGFLIIGSARWVGVSTMPMVAAVMLESGFADEPSWIRSIILGCWWFVTMELSWEAIDRRGRVRYTTRATMRRVQDVVTVVAIALVVGLVASSATSFSPVRSVALQAVVLGGLLAAFLSLVRHVATNET